METNLENQKKKRRDYTMWNIVNIVSSSSAGHLEFVSMLKFRSVSIKYVLESLPGIEV